MPEPLAIVTLAFALVGAILFIAGLAAIRQRRWLGTMLGFVLGLLFLALAALAWTLVIAMEGYRALTREEVAATVVAEPIGPQRVRATFRFPDGAQASFDLAGDAVYVDAHIVKWHPRANMLGLHTAYQLDRVAGRYADIEEERTRPRTVFPLAEPKAVSLPRLARRFPFLSPIVDAEYGSATFMPVRGRTELELRVSTTGLLFRPVRRIEDKAPAG
jgi:uncharacterized protein (DUF58 family)